MVFIRKNRNFNTKTRFSCRKQQFTSKIVLYSGKLSFYHEETKPFYVENDVFQRKIFRNAVLQLEKMVFIRNFNKKKCRKQQFTSIIDTLQWKTQFLSEETKILRRKRCFLEKIFQECRFTVEKMVFIRKNRNFNTKTRFSCRKQQFTSKIVLYSGKLSFYKKKRKVYVENDVFQRKFFMECSFTVEKMVFISKSRNFNMKTRFSCRKQQFTSIIVLYSGKLSFYQKKPFYSWEDVFLSGKVEILTRK